jgi:hypothetical protein
MGRQKNLFNHKIFSAQAPDHFVPLVSLWFRDGVVMFRTGFLLVSKSPPLVSCYFPATFLLGELVAFASVCSCLLVFARDCSCLLVIASVCCLLAFASVCSCLLVFALVWLCLLVFARVW